MLSVVVDYETLCSRTSPADPEPWQPLPGSLEAVSRLTRADWRVLVIGPVSRDGTPDLARLTRLHSRLSHAVANAGGEVDAVFFCPHGPEADCTCHPPAPGLLEDIARRQQLRLTQLPCITPDRGPVLEAAQRAGMQCLTLGAEGDFADLDAAVQFLLEDTDS